MVLVTPDSEAGTIVVVSLNQTEFGKRYILRELSRHSSDARVALAARDRTIINAYKQGATLQELVETSGFGIAEVQRVITGHLPHLC